MKDDTQIIQALKHMRMPLMIVGADGIIAQSNEANNQLFAHDNLIGQSVLDVLDIESVAALTALVEPPAVDAVIKGMTGRTRTGTALLLSVNLTIWHDAERGLQHALALTDIDPEDIANRVSNEALERANCAVNGARIGIFEYNPLNDSVVVSDLWRELTNLDAPLSEIQAEWRARVHPDDLKSALLPVQMCIEGKLDRGKSEHRFLAEDGSHWRWMHADISVARRDKDGRVTRLIGAMTDVTDRHMVDESLRISQEQFRSAFEYSTVGKVIVAPDGHFLRVNRALCAMLGYSQTELLQTGFQEITHRDDLESNLQMLDQLKSNAIPSFQVETRFLRANGSVMWGLVGVSMVKGPDGTADHFIAQIVDIADQKRLDEMKGQFVATVSHELRTPLTSVLGALALLSSMDEEPFSDEARRLLFIAQENGNRLNALISDILDFEKFSARQMQFTPLPYPIAGLLDQAVLANLVIADKFGVNFAVNCPDRSLIAYVDAKRFQQVMTNLLTNAAKFANPDSTVEIAIEPQSGFVKISVVNIGETIPDDFRDRAFKPFSQASTRSTQKRGGTGLGLNITKQIVEKTGGTIGFDSTAEGRTTFWFTVPTTETHD